MVSSVEVKPVNVGRVVGLSLGKFAYVGGVLGLLALCAPALAGPEGENVVAGSAQFARQGDLTVIHAANNTIIDYASFNIAQHETVQFVQPGATARVLNRVYGELPTHIDGTLSANGMVYFANPAGIYFGGQAIVNVGGLVAAAGTITNTDFLSGIDHFTNMSGTVENLGTIHAQTVHLVGRHVVNRGTVISPGGLVTMTAGEDVYLGKRDGHLFVRIEGGALAGKDSAGVENTGTVNAAGGRAVMMAGDMAGLAIKQAGSVKAADVHIEGTGKGEVRVTGTLDASDNFFGHGGSVTVTGERVSLDDALVDVSGTFGGGSVRIGGDYQGKGDLRASDLTFVSSDSRINADATISGDGGSVILWSDGLTAFGGDISARGGKAGGDGGFVEVSGKRHLIYQGKVDLRAAKGAWGELLLDPTNIIVDDANIETADLTAVDEFSDPNIAGNGSNNTILDVDAINNAAAMANVTLQATNDITFDAPISTVNDNVSITAVAGNDIIVNQTITLRGGNISFTANSSAAGGGQTGSGSIDINAALSTAGGGVTGGEIILLVDGGTGSINLGADLSTAGGTVTLNNDAVALTGNVVIDTDPAGGTDAAGDIIFAGNSLTTGAFTLALNAAADGGGASGGVNLGAVDGATGLTVSGDNLALRGDLNVDGPIDLRSGLTSITLFDNEQLGQAGTGTQIDSTGGSDAAISLANTSGDFDLEIIGDAASAITLGVVDVNSLDVTGGAVSLNGNLTADTSIDFSGAGAIALGGNRTITANDAGTPGSITFGAGNVITGANALTIDGGAVTLHQIGNGVADPTALAVKATTLTLHDSITVDGSVDLRTNVGAITLADNVAINNTGGTNAPISLANTTGNFNLELTGDAGSALTLGATDVNGLDLTGGTLSLNGNITSDTALSFVDVGAISYAGATTIRAADSDNGNASQDITFDAGNVITGTSPLTIDGDTITLFAVGNGTTDPNALAVAADTELLLNGDITVDGPVDLRTNVSSLTLSGNRTINTSGAPAGAGAIALQGLASNTTLTLTAQAASPITLGAVDVDTLNLTGGALTLLGNVTSDSALDFTNVGNIVLGGAVTITAADSDGGNAPQNITFDAANVFTGAHNLTIDGDTVTLFGVGNGTSDPTALTVAADTVLNLNGDVTVDGAVDLRTGVASLNLVGNRTINTSGAGAGAGTIMLRGLTSASALTLNAQSSSAITLGSVDVDALTLLAGGTLNLLGDITSDAALNFSNVGQIVLGAPVTITARDSDAGNAARNITFDSGNTITGAQALAIDGDTVTLPQIGNGAADPTTLAVSAETSLVLTGNITVDDAVDLRSNVAAITLTGNTTIDTTGGTNAAISLANTAGDFNLALVGDAGSALTLGATDVNGLALTGGTVSLNGDITSDTALDFTNAGAINFAGPTTIAAGDGGAAQNITFDAANVITGDDALTLNGAAVTLFDVGNGVADPTALSVTATTLSLNGDITVDGAADLRSNVGAITLGANAGVDVSGGTNAAIMLADVTGDFDLTLTGDGGGSALTLGAVDVNALALTGGALSLNGNITSDSALDFTNVEAISYTGDVTITARDGGTAADITTDAANVFTGTGALAFNGDNLTLNQIGSGGTNPSSVDIAADGTVTLAGTVNSAGDITLRPGTAGTTIGLHDGTGTFSVSAASLGQLATTGSVIIGDAASGAINVAGSGFIDLSGTGFDLTLRGDSVTFNTGANNGIQLAADRTLTIETSGGGVLTNGGANLDVIIAGPNGSLVIDAADAIATSPDALSTQVARLAAAASAGGVFVTNTGGLTIASINGVNGVTAGSNGDISITAASPVVVDAPVSATGSGEVSIRAAGGDTGDLTVNAPITSESGDISLFADNDAVFTAAGDVTSTSGAINAAADFDLTNSGGPGTGGSLTMADGTVFTTGGNIALSSDGDLTVGSLVATDGGANVDITTVAGDILDGNDDTAGNNVTHAAGAGVTTLTASAGAVGGGGNGLELELNGSSLDVAAQDGLALAVAGDLSGAFTITNGFLNLTADGTIATTGAWLADSISISAGDVSIGHAVAGTTSVTIDLNAPGTIGVGDATGDLTITGAELELITTPTLTIGGANTTAMTVDNVTAAQSNNADLVILAAAGDVTFNGTASTFNALSVQANDGATVEVDLTTDTGALTLNGDANDTADGFDGLTIAPGVAVTAAGDLTTAATTGGVSIGDGATLASGGTVTLEDATVAQGALTVEAIDGITISGGLAAANGAATLDADSDADGAGMLTVASGGSIDASGQALTLAAADMDLLGSVTATGGSLEILRSGSGSIGLGDASGDLRLDNTDLANIIADDATIGGASVTALTVDNAAVPNVTGTLTLDATGGAATFENGDSSFGGALDVVATAVTFNAGVTTAGSLTATSDQDLEIGGVTLVSGGAMNLNSVGGDIVLTGADGSTATLDVNADTDLTLGTVVTTGANNPNLTVESDGGVTLADVDLGAGILSVIVDANDNGAAAATLAGVTAGGIAATGGAGDTLTLTSPVSTSTTAGVSLTAETVNLNSDIVTTGGGGVGVTNSGTLTVAQGVALTLDGAFGQAGGGSVSWGGLLITTDDSVFFTGPITLTADSSLNTGTGGGDVNFGGSINGDFSLDVAAGTGVVSFAAAVGDVTPLSGLNVVSSGGLDFGGDVAADDEGISLATSGPVTLNRTFTTTNGGDFTIDNTGALTIDPAAVFALTGDFIQSGTGPVTLSGDFGTAGRRSTFNGAVTLTSDVVLRGSEFTFGGTVDSDSAATPRSVAFETSDLTIISAAMGETNPLRSFTSSTTGVTRLAGSVVTTSGSTFRNPVVLTGDAVVMDTGADSAGVFFNSTIDGDGGGARNLTVLVNNQNAANDAEIPVIRFGADVGATQALGSLLLNFSQAAGFVPRANVPLVATITAQPLDANGNPIPLNALPTFGITFNTTGDFRMGQNEKLTVLGDLTINSSGGTVRIGDVTALRTLAINAPTIRVLSRSGARLLARDGSSAQEDADAGTDLVVGESITFSTAPSVEGGGTVRLTTPTGGNISPVSDGFIGLAFEGEFVPQLFVLQSDPTRLLDLRAEGVSTQNIAQAIAGAVPRETRANDVGQNTTVSQGQLERLEQIGIYPRDLSPRELVEFLSGRALYYDYPRKADPGAADYQVTKRRLSAERITALLDLYDEVFREPAVDPATGRTEVDELGHPVLMDRAQQISQSLGEAASAYRMETGAGRIDPIALRAFIEASPDYAQLAADLDNVGRFLDALDQVGLSRRETLNARLAILQKLAPPSLGVGATGAATLEEMIRGERAVEVQ